MSYILSVQEQWLLFCKSLGFGFLVGIGYDVCTLLRVVFCKGRGLVAWEIAYGLLAAVSSFLFDLTLNGGNLRLYMLLAECVGFCLWYFGAGVPIRRGAQRCSLFLSRCVRRISAPFCCLSGKIKQLEEKGKNNFEKIFKKTNVLLKLRGKMVYNPNNSAVD